MVGGVRRGAAQPTRRLGLHRRSRRGVAGGRCALGGTRATEHPPPAFCNSSPGSGARSPFFSSQWLGPYARVSARGRKGCAGAETPERRSAAGQPVGGRAAGPAKGGGGGTAWRCPRGCGTLEGRACQSCWRLRHRPPCGTSGIFLWACAHLVGRLRVLSPPPRRPSSASYCEMVSLEGSRRGFEPRETPATQSIAVCAFV